MLFPNIISAVASAAFLATFVLAGDKCYYLDGSPAAGVYRCNNATSGESSCCNAGQICYSNGVCQAGPENHATDWLRVGCTDPTWSSPACLKQCTTLVRDSSAGIRPCGGILTSDKYCCDTQGLGPGSLACCKNSSNIFAINPIPSIIATIPLMAFASVPSTVDSSATSTSTHGLIPLSTLSGTSTSTSTSSAISDSTTTTATTHASSDTPPSSTATSSSPVSAPPTASSTTTGPALATNTSSLASRFGSVGTGVSFAFTAVLAGFIYSL